MLEFPFLYILTSILSFFDRSHLTGVRYYITVVLICGSLMIGNVEHLFMYILAITCLWKSVWVLRPSFNWILAVCLLLSCTKGDQSWVFIGRADVETETPILWPPDTKS